MRDKTPEPASWLFREALRLCDRAWNPRLGLLRPLTAGEGGRSPEMGVVRESLWYAIGLLSRGGEVQIRRAGEALNAVLENQIDAPGQPYHGTFRRHTEERFPEAGATVWKDYDPNWREFLGTGLCLVLNRFRDKLQIGLVRRVERALRMAVMGSLARDVSVSYTNIFLLKMALLGCAGGYLAHREWTATAAWMACVFSDQYRAANCFEEFNSPTYYGVNVFALRMMQVFSPSVELRHFAARMERALWSDVARFYHPGFRNMCGPYDRTYGMDMRSYVSLLGLWISRTVPPAEAPVPLLTEVTPHVHDLPFTCCFSLLATEAPDGTVQRLRYFDGPRSIVINDFGRDRTITAWMDDQVMLGASSRAVRDWNQCAPATVQRHPSGNVAWMRLKSHRHLVASVEERCLRIHNPHASDQTQCCLHVYCPPIAATRMAPTEWTLPGLRVVLDPPTGSVFIKATQQVVRVALSVLPRSNLRLRVQPRAPK